MSLLKVNSIVHPSATSNNISFGSDGSVSINSGISSGGIIPELLYYRLDTSLVGANTTNAQNIFGVGVTLSSSTVYYFEMEFTLSKSVGATSHTIALGYGGTATYNNVYINTTRYGATGSTFPWTVVTTTGSVVQSTNTVSSTVVTGSIANASYVDRMTVKGTISTNAGGTFIPQYTLSAAPGGAYSTIAGGYVLIYPIGTAGVNVSAGTWA